MLTKHEKDAFGAALFLGAFFALQFALGRGDDGVGGSRPHGGARRKERLRRPAVGEAGARGGKGMTGGDCLPSR